MESDQYIRIEDDILFFPNNNVQIITENPNIYVLSKGFNYDIISDFPFDFNFFLATY